MPEYFECARVNCLLPHQEWLTDEDRGRLRDIDMVFFKTRHAMDILASEARASALVGIHLARSTGLCRVPAMGYGAARKRMEPP